MFVPKHSRMIDNIEDVVIGLYALGMNTRDIEDQIKDIYHIGASETTRFTRSQVVFPDVSATLKAVYLAINIIENDGPGRSGIGA
jgi:transposase-like protein